MSKEGNVFSEGGGGTNFEQLIQVAFITTLITQGNAPCVHTGTIKKVALQTSSLGYETDDLLVVSESVTGKNRLLIQIKHSIIISKKSALFKEVMTAFWKDYNNDNLFNKTKDKLVIVTSGLNDEKREVKEILNWAKSKASSTDFIIEITRIKSKKEKLDI